VYRHRDGREVDDHVYSTFEYPGGRTAVFSSIESNAFDHYYEAFFGTKGTLVLRGEADAYLFDEGDGARATGIEITAAGADPVLEASESRTADAAGQARAGTSAARVDRLAAYRNEISGFCAAVRTGTPLQCGPDNGFGSAIACIRAVEAIEQKTRLPIRTPGVPERT
jgi:predicted dehydrogenase